MSTAMTKRIPLVVLENNVLQMLVREQRFRDEFPFLQHAKSRAEAAPLKPGCAPCQKRKAQLAALDTDSIKRDISGLASDRKALLKRMLNADKVRMVYKGGAAKLIRFTF